MKIKNEYEALRTEIKDWQDRRFTILTGSIALVTAVLGLKVFEQPANVELWPYSALLLLLLSCACALTWYARRGSAIIAAYLIIFHERRSDSKDGWEDRLRRLQLKGVDKLSLNQFLGLIYLVLGVVAVAVPVLQKTPTYPGCIILIIASFLFLCSLLLLFIASSEVKKDFLEKWKNLPSDPGHNP